MQHIVISFARHSKSDTQKLIYLLRSIEKFIKDDIKLTIVGSSVEGLLKKGMVEHINIIPPFCDSIYERHSKNICYIVNNIRECFVVLNGTIFVKELKKSNFSQIAIFRNPHTDISKSYSSRYEYTVNDLKQKKMFKFSTLPLVFFPYNFSLIEKYRWKYPELYSEMVVFPVVYSNLVPNSSRAEFKKESFIIKPVDTFVQVDKISKNTRAIFITNKLDIAYKVKLDKMFPEKSRWEI